jgi:hypothetical protein
MLATVASRTLVLPLEADEHPPEPEGLLAANVAPWRALTEN